MGAGHGYDKGKGRQVPGQGRNDGKAKVYGIYVIKRPNIILIVLDTTRLDALSPYNDHINTPNISKFSRDSVIYDNTISASPWTIPSHVSFLTGKYVSEHGINRNTVMEENVSTIRLLRNRYLPNILQESGYKTIGISANNIVSPVFGFDYGFDFFLNIDSTVNIIPEAIKKSVEGMGGTRIKVVKEMIKKVNLPGLWNLYKYSAINRKNRKIVNYPIIKGGNDLIRTLEGFSSSEPFFLFLNLMEMHEPYRNKHVYDRKYNKISEQSRLDIFMGSKIVGEARKERLKETYFDQSQVLDSLFGKIISKIKSLGIYDDSMIILLSDHGQSFGEDNWYYHGHLLYDELVRVPLMVKYPGNVNKKGRKGSEKEYYSLTDIYSLIRSCANGDCEDLPIREVVFSEAYSSKATPWWSNIDLSKYQNSPRDHLILKSSKKAVFRDGYKLVLEGLKGDPLEFTYMGEPVSIETNYEILESMKEELITFSGLEDFKIVSGYSA